MFSAAPLAALGGLPAQSTLDLPLTVSAGGVFSTSVRLGTQRFSLIVDTGSPYLLVPAEASCLEQPPRLSLQGCIEPSDFRRADAEPTVEVYGAKSGRVTWYEAPAVSFEGVRRGLRGGLVFGGADRVVSIESGALLGLIKRVNTGPTSTLPLSQLRPTVLGQAPRWWGKALVGYRIDGPRRRLRLSSEALIPAETDALPLYDPRADGDGVEHVCCRVEGLRVNGVAVRPRRLLLAVFDTGLTGCCLSHSLVGETRLGLPADALPAAASRRSMRLDSVRSVEVALRTERGEALVLRSGGEEPLFYAQSIKVDWFTGAPAHGPHVIALGQAFLGRGVLTVDIDAGRATFA